MKFISYAQDGVFGIGAVIDGRIAPIEQPGTPMSLKVRIAEGTPSAFAASATPSIDLTAVTLLPVITN